ncbi:MAG: hypothetical protein KF871_14790 [Hydrogenophaga sp.]|uniref:hypothetical protein n=1 Tax=Hydrogenophaga sp. TaxID=1904254 RepID=UPI001E0A0F5A|nr:hypothetical protein [Hydrogenophaga sp.]MBX3611155.1 hypothetical protein [Hydrogenophaga sp.]
MQRVRRFTWLAALTSVLLGGCASVIKVDNQVQSFARWQAASPANAAPAVPAPPQVFRFERLPSQQNLGQQDELEKLTEAALGRKGWSRAADGVSAPWLVQVNASTVRLPRAPWEDPYDAWGPFGYPYALPGRDYVVTGTGQVMFFPAFPRFETPYYQRAVALLVREAASGRVVYETRAAHDGRWNSTPSLWTAMLDAALNGFPSPPAGNRQVDIDIAR